MNNSYKYIIVDRIEMQDESIQTEFDRIVCELANKNRIVFLRRELYKGVKVGDVLVLDNGKYVYDEEQTIERKNTNVVLQEEVFYL